METDEGASVYMDSYGEGPDYITRHTVGSFINDNESVLDVGCGPGWNLDHFVLHGPIIKKYRGLDYSGRFVRIANHRRRHMQYDPDVYLPYKLGDVRVIDEPNESWDVVLLQDVLEHTNGYEKPIKQALRVARKRVIVTFWHLDGNEGTEHINVDGNDGYGAWYDQSKWESFLDKQIYPWHHLELMPEGKTHKWDFYVIEKEDVTNV